jgi:hypothetical protein
MRIAVMAVVTSAGLAACANDPEYIPAPDPMEAGIADMTGKLSVAKASLQLPIKTESSDDAKARAALAAKLDPIEVPYVRVGDLEIEVEWTIQNLDTTDGQAKIELNGANELFSYDPSIIVLDPGDDEAPPTPGLTGDVPLDVAAGRTISGLFTEDQLREAAIDLDQITRGNVNPFFATLTVSKNAQSFQPLTPSMPPAPGASEPPKQDPVGDPIPREAFAEITRIDLVFKPTTHMVLNYTVRVRDLRGIMHPLLLTAVTEKPDELETFDPMEYNPTPATPTPQAP